MLDREGFRPNVGIILLNTRNEVWWGKRVREHSWQFPQGGIQYGETPEQAMFRELEEEVGLRAEHVRILGRTRDWLRYEVPDHFIKREIRGHYRGQKQIWYLPLDGVIEFKRDVYARALRELARYMARPVRSAGVSRGLRLTTSSALDSLEENRMTLPEFPKK